MELVKMNVCDYSTVTLLEAIEFSIFVIIILETLFYTPKFILNFE